MYLSGDHEGHAITYIIYITICTFAATMRVMVSFDSDLKRLKNLNIIIARMKTCMPATN